jgi:hypothetical protein
VAVQRDTPLAVALQVQAQYRLLFNRLVLQPLLTKFGLFEASHLPLGASEVLDATLGLVICPIVKASIANLAEIVVARGKMFGCDNAHSWYPSYLATARQQLDWLLEAKRCDNLSWASSIERILSSDSLDFRALEMLCHT